MREEQRDPQRRLIRNAVLESTPHEREHAPEEYHVFAVSFVVRAAIHTARHTSMLQRIPRLKSSQAGMAIFISATFKNRSI